MSRQGIFSIIWKQLTKKRESYQETIMGRDVFGNIFYESNQPNYKGQQTRFHVPPGSGDIINKISPEWDAWLRYRRQQAPSETEVMSNVKMSEMRKMKAEERLQEQKAKYPEYAKRLEEMNVKQSEMNEFKSSYPKHSGAENFPGYKKKS